MRFRRAITLAAGLTAIGLLLLGPVGALEKDAGPFGWTATDTWMDCYGSGGFGDPPDRQVEPGDVVAAFVDGDLCCGGCTVDQVGLFGFLAVYGDDATTPEKDGAAHGDTVRFAVWDATADSVWWEATWLTTWEAGTVEEVSIQASLEVEARTWGQVKKKWR